MSNSIQKILILGGGAGLLLLAYFLFVKPDQFELQVTGSNAVAEAVLARTQVFIERRAQLDTVVIDGQLFADPRFTTLRSYSSPLTDQTIGKDSLFDGVVRLNASEGE